ncbi:glycosyltransferase [Sphingomonas bacterium]|uniref:glycosyltransferase n=1 Tax=Sphingomonas bacterium TaxID=1895847 RepID=UPI001576407D|nr:glycosyltransferase [Sphingomonas bacterium]
MTEPFYFGIPLIARAAAGDWQLVEHLFDLTLRSVMAQDDADFRVLLAGHDLPRAWSAVADDPRFTWLPADWAPEPPTAANDDGGRKKWLVRQRMRQAGGGLLMFLDADDWVARDLVRRAREQIGPQHLGGVVGAGFALDYRTGRVMRFPIAGAFEGDFHQLCGSSTVGRIAGEDHDRHPDPHAVLGSHHEWVEAAARTGTALARLDVTGMYLVGTGENHSEAAGPFARWRCGITEAVRSHGVRLDDGLAAHFGQEPLLPQSLHD